MAGRGSGMPRRWAALDAVSRRWRPISAVVPATRARAPAPSRKRRRSKATTSAARVRAGVGHHRRPPEQERQRRRAGARPQHGGHDRPRHRRQWLLRGGDRAEHAEGGEPDAGVDEAAPGEQAEAGADEQADHDDAGDERRLVVGAEPVDAETHEPARRVIDDGRSHGRHERRHPRQDAGGQLGHAEGDPGGDHPGQRCPSRTDPGSSIHHDLQSAAAAYALHRGCGDAADGTPVLGIPCEPAGSRRRTGDRRTPLQGVTRCLAPPCPAPRCLASATPS